MSPPPSGDIIYVSIGKVEQLVLNGGQYKQKNLQLSKITLLRVRRRRQIEAEKKGQAPERLLLSLRTEDPGFRHGQVHSLHTPSAIHRELPASHKCGRDSHLGACEYIDKVLEK